MRRYIIESQMCAFSHGRIRNVISLSRNITKRIQRALQELSETLANPQPQPQPIPVRVPVRNSSRGFQRMWGVGLQSRRCFTTFTAGFTSGGGAGTSWSFNHFTNMNNSKTNFFSRIKLFSKFYNTARGGTASGAKIFNNLNHGFMFHNFSQANQNTYRMKLHQSKLRFSLRPILNQFKDSYHTKNNEEFSINKRFAPFLAKHKNPSIRLNLSLTPQNHQITLQLARTESSASNEEKIESNQLNPGSYVEFPINFNLNIPHETLLSEEILDEMLFSVKAFEQKLRSFKEDLHNLFELGELPIKYIPSKNVLRVYFPNCDAVKLESLCREKNITGGVIYEDFGDAEVPNESYRANVANHPSSTPSIDQNDILSSYFTSDNSASSISETQDPDDLLSDSLVTPLTNEDIVRIVDFQEPQIQTMFSTSEESYWVSA